MNQQRVAGNRSQAFRAVSYGRVFIYLPSVFRSSLPTNCVQVLFTYQVCSGLFTYQVCSVLVYLPSVFSSCFPTDCVQVLFSYQLCSGFVYLPSFSGLVYLPRVFRSRFPTKCVHVLFSQQSVFRSCFPNTMCSCLVYLKNYGT